MSAPLTKKTTDYTELDSFSFGFCCDCCGEEWRSSSVQFETDIVIDHEETKRLLWAQEHKAAFEAANLEAHLHFNNCPKCGKWVCDDCFDINGVDCKECC